MGKRVIAAINPDGPAAPLYFLGYRDEGEAWEGCWTCSRARARCFEADEAEIEMRLLGPRYAGWLQSTRRVLAPEPLGA